MYELKKTYSYDDVTLVPHYSDLKSRGETDPSMFGFDLPIIMSPMDTVTTPDMIRLFVNNNLVASVHRAFKTAEEQFNYVVDSKNRSETKDEIDKIVKGTWFSVGSIWKYKEWINYLYEHGVVNFLVDMAHGDSLACIETVNYIRKLKNVNHIIAGNVATKSGFRHLQDAGANGIRIGIASGSICSTAMETGFGVPILTNIIDCLQVKDDNVWMIADGGCKYTGDIAKAIYFGADFVMCGKMLASTSLACGKLYNSKCQLIEKDPIFVDSLTDEEENELSSLESDYVNDHIVKYRGYKGMACYSKDTEVLTKNGWKYFYELNNDDEIATLNKDTYKLEYHKYLNFFEYDFNGNMYLIKDNFIDLLITPNHNVFTKGRYKNSQYNLEQIDFIANKRKKSIFKKDCCWDGKKINSFTLPNSDITFPINDWLYFYGFWIAEGCTYKTKQKIRYDVFCTSFSNNNKELIDKCVKILNNAGINTKIRKRKNNYEVISYNRYLYNYLSSFGKSIDKYIDPIFLELCSESLNYILQGIYDGDGCEKRKSIYTVSKKLLDNISEICLKTNRTPKISLSRKSVYNYKKFKRNYILYSINISDYAHEHIVNMEKNCTLLNYNDKVYCIEVPNNVIYVRRNNKMCWCGNSRDARKGILSYASVEGHEGCIKYTGKTEQFILDTKLRLQASLSYGGARDWKSFRRNVKAVMRSSSGIVAADTHLDVNFDK